MSKKKFVLLSFLSFCLIATLLVGVTSSVQPYDPWCDVNCDGIIDIVDIVSLAIRFGEEGTPISHAAVQFKGNISVPAAAFVPYSYIESWVIAGWGMTNKDPDHWASFVADVQLPHGATITNMTFYWRDFGDSNIMCTLYRTSTLHVSEAMAQTWSTGNTTDMGLSYTDTIGGPVVDNDHHAYYLDVSIPPDPTGETYVFYAAFIEYEYL